MSLTYNYVEVEEVTYNGQPLEQVTYNGTLVWTSQELSGLSKIVVESGYVFKGNTPFTTTFKNNNNIANYIQTGVPVVQSDGTFTLTGDNVI